ncbi:hypothetical protein C8Q70DRAFT_935624 [Cubamyces menziesii]|nr:hypothetical protein C8Q70DRAFT_935624 [Cubamyces menziesii]
MQSRTQYGFLFQDHESHPEKKRAWNEDVQEDGNVKRQRVERSDGQGNDRRKSDAAVDLTRYREDQTGDDYSEEYSLTSQIFWTEMHSVGETMTSNILPLPTLQKATLPCPISQILSSLPVNPLQRSSQ